MKQILLFFLLLFFGAGFAQKEFTRQDSLRGSITPERAWWDVTYYHLRVKVNIEEKTISGSNQIQYYVLEPKQTLQIELQEPLRITKVMQGAQELQIRKEGYSYFIELIEKQKKGEVKEVVVWYEGTPQESKNPPWSGGLTWEKDENGNDWVATTCQGDGASLWWPNKDHAYDEPDSMLISVTVPKHLMDVSNGQLRGIKEHEKTRTFHWFVSNPINNYGINMNIGDFVHFDEVYKGLKGNLKCDYYVLRGNETKAREQFKEVPRMFKAFEHWFGPYPFYEDGYKLVEVPYAGMEHQSSVTYGNGFKNGYLGRDVSGTGWGMKFDFIIVHESGHEWFANNITHKDVADMWIHESFTSYSENLFVEHYYGKEAGAAYVVGTRKNILNDRPIIGVYDVHYEGSGDMYYKGGNILHSLRQIVNDDERWRSILVGMNEKYYHQTVTSKQIEDHLSREVGINLDPFFDQYLRTIDVPILEYRTVRKGLEYRYKNVVEGFNYPVVIKLGDELKRLSPTTNWQKLDTDQSYSFDVNFYVEYKEVEND